MVKIRVVGSKGHQVMKVEYKLRCWAGLDLKKISPSRHQVMKVEYKLSCSAGLDLESHPVRAIRSMNPPLRAYGPVWAYIRNREWLQIRALLVLRSVEVGSSDSIEWSAIMLLV